MQHLDGLGGEEEELNGVGLASLERMFVTEVYKELIETSIVNNTLQCIKIQNDTSFMQQLRSIRLRVRGSLSDNQTE